MDIRQLTTFRTAATVLSFTRAARELKYAQSSVTAQIKNLEVSLGVELFERVGARVQLTEAGRRLLPYAEQMVALADEARGVAVGRREPAGLLTVGTTENVTSYRLPPLLEFFHHRYPLLQLALRPSLGDETCQALRQGAFDLGFLTEAETDHRGLRGEVLGPEPLTLVAAPSHPLVYSRSVTVADLRGVPVLMPQAGCGYRELFERALSDDGRPQLLEFGTIESIKWGVAGGLGVSLLPSVAVAGELASRALAAVAWKPPFTVYNQLVWRRGKHLSCEMRLFIEQTVRVIAEGAPAVTRLSSLTA
ncbi:LysR family transcriptional regulator [Streptomyces sp. NPDC059373]